MRVRGTTSKRVLAKIAGSRARSVRITGVDADDGRLVVTVSARDRRGRTGKAGTARA